MTALLWVLACATEPQDTGTDTSPAIATDEDGDGFPARLDCDDADASANTGATEVCNGKDDDCDALVDDADDGVAGQLTGFVDADGDGWGDAAWVACAPPALSSESGGDCDDQDATVSPGTVESCNGRDDDCDAIVDDSCDSAPSGELTVDDAQVQVLGPCPTSRAGTDVAVGDLDGDGLADLVTSGRCDEADRILGSRGSFGPEVLMDFAADTVLAEPADTPDYEPSSPRLVDVDNDGRTELVTRDGWQGVLLFREPRWGMFTDEADLTLRVDTPGVDAYESLWTFWGTAIPGDDGGAIVITAAWVVSDWTQNETWIADASATGPVSTNDLGTLGPEGRGNNPNGSNILTYDAGDLDGDGNHEMLLAAQELIDLYMGPLFPVVGERSPDMRFGGGAPSDGHYDDLSVNDATYGDLDGDGYDELLVHNHEAFGLNGPSRLSSVVWQAGELTSTLSMPFLVAGADGDWRNVSPTFDANGDGVLDLAVADSSRSNGVELEGVVYVEYGPFEGTREVPSADGAVIVGTEASDQAGATLAAGDTNGDGFDDLALGSYRGNNDHASGPGTTFLFLGGP